MQSDAGHCPSPLRKASLSPKGWGFLGGFPETRTYDQSYSVRKQTLPSCDVCSKHAVNRIYQDNFLLTQTSAPPVARGGRAGTSSEGCRANPWIFPRRKAVKKSKTSLPGKPEQAVSGAKRSCCRCLPFLSQNVIRKYHSAALNTSRLQQARRTLGICQSVRTGAAVDQDGPKERTWIRWSRAVGHPG